MQMPLLTAPTHTAIFNFALFVLFWIFLVHEAITTAAKQAQV